MDVCYAFILCEFMYVLNNYIYNICLFNCVFFSINDIFSYTLYWKQLLFRIYYRFSNSSLFKFVSDVTCAKWNQWTCNIVFWVLVFNEVDYRVMDVGFKEDIRHKSAIQVFRPNIRCHVKSFPKWFYDKYHILNYLFET